MPRKSVQGFKQGFKTGALHAKKVYAGFQEWISTCQESQCRVTKLDIDMPIISWQCFKTIARHAKKVLEGVQIGFTMC